MIAFQVLSRILSLVGKEFVEVVRRPGVLFSLVLGPFLLMAVFGLGYSDVRSPIRAVLIIPADSGLSTDPTTYSTAIPPGGELNSVGTDAAVARQRVRDGRIDLAVIIPPGMQQDLEAGRQPVVEVDYDLVDPIKANYALVMAQQVDTAINQAIVARAVEQGASEAAQAGLRTSIPPSVIASPTTVRTSNLAASVPALVPFFGPAALALILQHMAITLTALSLVRERHTGILGILRLAPVSPIEIILGKAVAFAALGGFVAAAVLALLVLALGVPILGDLGSITLTIALLIGASLGVGLFISAVADSERQAVQLSMLVLLASVFFGGFVFELQDFTPLVRALAAVLPVTHGIPLLQSLMLTGAPVDPVGLLALTAIAVATLGATWFLLGRSLRPVA